MRMSGHQDSTSCNSRTRFRLQFQQGLREYLARNDSTVQAFAAVWEKTLEQVKIEQAEQPELYWELIQWARSYDLFTATEVKQVTSVIE